MKLNHDIESALNELRDACDFLQTSSDMLGQYWVRVIGDVERMRPGVTVWLEDPVLVTDDGPSQRRWQFGYARVGTRFGFAARDARSPESEPVEITNASRAVRSAAAKYVPELLRQLSARVRVFARSMNDERAALVEPIT